MNDYVHMSIFFFVLIFTHTEPPVMKDVYMQANSTGAVEDTYMINIILNYIYVYIHMYYF